MAEFKNVLSDCRFHQVTVETEGEGAVYGVSGRLKRCYCCSFPSVVGGGHSSPDDRETSWTRGERQRAGPDL